MKLSISRSDLEKLAQVVREETGNHVSEKNFAMLESRIRSHILKLQIYDFRDYWDYFAKNEATEREVLQSLMTTHYTYFFRELKHFDILGEWLSFEWSNLKERYEKYKIPLRVWSAACSRGQEVYSLAMYLEKNCFEAYGLPYEILGTDIDVESVAYARNGVYPMKEVNTIPRLYLQNNWKKGTGAVSEFAAVQSRLREKVKFEAMNLLEIANWKPDLQFDVIFCRNVFIYFAQYSVEKIAKDMKLRINDRGLFISGMSEPLRFSGWDLKTIGPSSYQKLTAEKPRHITPQVHTQQNEPKAGAIGHKTLIARLQSSEAKTNVVTEKRSEGYRVLCVDDSPTIQTLLKKIFSSDVNCKKIDLVSSANEARIKLDEQKYDLVTLDIHMPEVTGVEFLEKMYDRKRDPPVVMISSVNRKDIELATKSLKLGAFDYVEKPAMNNLAKSRDEILTKAMLAIRSSQNDIEIEQSSFDAEIGIQIVVPDASQCARIVLASMHSIKDVQQIVKSQSKEYRSPALVILWRGELTPLESALLQATHRKIQILREFKTLLRPNVVYIVTDDHSEEFAHSLRVRSISLQILDSQLRTLSSLREKSQIQMLVSEDLSSQTQSFERAYGVSVSDVSPATSFSSLSVEFFAHLRKAAA